MVSIEEHRELEKRIKQLETDRDEARSALLAQREDINSNQESIKNVEKDTKKNKEDIESLEKRVRDLKGKLLVDADTLKGIQDKIDLLEKAVNDGTIRKVPDKCWRKLGTEIYAATTSEMFR